MEESQEDLRSVGTPPEEGEGLRPTDPPEPLVVPPEELRQLYREEYDRMLADEGNRVYIHVAEYLKVKSYKQMFRFMGLHMRIYQDARSRPGFVGGGIRGQWWKKRFWTYTIWESREDMERFTKSGEHAQAVNRVREFAAPGSCYVEWEAGGEPDWSGAISRLEHPTRYFVDPFFE